MDLRRHTIIDWRIANNFEGSSQWTSFLFSIPFSFFLSFSLHYSQIAYLSLSFFLCFLPTILLHSTSLCLYFYHSLFTPPFFVPFWSLSPSPLLANRLFISVFLLGFSFSPFLTCLCAKFNLFLLVLLSKFIYFSFLCPLLVSFSLLHFCPFILQSARLSKYLTAHVKM